MKSAMPWQRALQTTDDLYATHTVLPRSTAGIPIGVICVQLVYPKMPGNVVNASTFDFPVTYITLDFEIERLFAGDPAIEQMVIDAARELEAQGVRAIVGACGYFAHFQKSVASAVSVPVYMSSLCQLPVIRLGLKPDQEIAVFCADSDGFNNKLLANVGETLEGLVPVDVCQLDSFSPIRWGKTTLDNAQLAADLADLAARVAEEHREIGAILLECSDLPPYACEIQGATGLPVFDFITLINWVHQAVCQTRYFGIL